jgi:hypothetical protein
VRQPPPRGNRSVELFGAHPEQVDESRRRAEWVGDRTAAARVVGSDDLTAELGDDDVVTDERASAVERGDPEERGDVVAARGAYDDRVFHTPIVGVNGYQFK